jgi:hypothetical protein
MPSRLPGRQPLHSPQRAVQYIRMSTDQQQCSPIFQRQAIAEYAAKHSIRIIRDYEDAGISGLTLRARPALNQLLIDVADPQRRFSLVLVYDVSRWGRFQDVDESAFYEYLCRRHGVKVVYVAEPFEGGFSSHAPVMVRSMLEGHANLLNLVGDPAFVDQIRYDNARADVVLFTEYAADPEMQGNADAQETLARWKADAEPVRDELEAKGYGKLDVYQRFKRANIMSTYVAYRVFCSFAHNQLTTLLARHADRFELRYHVEAPKALTASLLNVAVSILCQAVVTASHYTDLTDAELRQVIDSADATWSAAQALVE